MERVSIGRFFVLLFGIMYVFGFIMFNMKGLII